MTKTQFLRTLATVVFDTNPTRLSNSFFGHSQLKPRIQMLVNPKTSRQSLWRYALVLPIAAMLLMCSQKDPVSTTTPVGSRMAATDLAASKSPDGNEIFTVVEESPKFPGGIIC